MAVGRFDEFFRDFVKLREYIARQRAYAYNEHFNSSVNKSMSMLKLRKYHVSLGKDGGVWMGPAYP